MAAATTSFEFAPPVDKSEEEEEAMESDIETTKEAAAAVQSPSPVKYEFGANSNDASDDDDSEDESNEKPSPSKKKKEDGRAAIRALREGREKKGLRVSLDHRATHHAVAAQRKSPPRMNSPDPPTTADTAVAAAKTSLSTASTIASPMKYPDPPAAIKPASTARTSLASAKPAAARTKPKSNIPPPSVSSIFSNPKTKFSSAHRPYKQKFDPNKPFPSTGYKLPTAAYCGCGPTPGSQTSSVRGAAGSIGGTGGSYGDLCNTNTTTNTNTRNGSFTDTGNFVRGGMQNVTAVDPLCQRRYSDGGGDDERKMAAARPSPPGRNANWKEVEQQPMAQPAGVNAGRGEQANAPVAASVPAAATAPATPVNAGTLNAAISRVTSLLSHSAAGNQKRREMMGIRSTNVSQSVQSGNPNVQRGEQQPEKLGVPPRNVMLTEQQMDAMNATLDGGEEDANDTGRPPVDPPMIDSSSIPYAATLQKFRVAGTGTETGASATNPSSMGSAKKEPDDGTAAMTVAGEHTSEVGENQEIKPPAATEIADASMDHPSSSFLKRACLSIMKLIMFVQMAIGILYLANNHASFNWSDYIPSSEKLVQSIKDTAVDTVTTLEKEDSKSSCFIDHPPHFFDDDPNKIVELIHNHDEECEGNYKQCPPWGKCQAGKLIDCTDGEVLLLDGVHRFVPNEEGDACEVSAEVNELIKVVQEVLVGMTVAQTCKSADRITEAEDVLLEEYSFPLFRLEKVAERVRESSADEHVKLMSSDILIWLLPAFDSNLVRFGSLSGDDGDDLDAVGLGPDVSPSSLPLPLACTTKLVFWEFLELVATSALALLIFLTKKIWFLVTNYPIYVFSAIAFWKIMDLFWCRRKHQAKVRELFGIVREAAFDRLSECDDSDGYAALILRDDVTHDMYPTSFHQRQFINDYVWKRVTLEIRADNRVRKFRKVANGKELEHWDFAIQSKRGRRLRKSFGASTPGSSNRGDANVEDEAMSPKRRDP